VAQMCDGGLVRSMRLIVPLGLLVCIGLILPGSALALRAHPFLETFGSAEQPSLLEPEGMAVDQATGDLLVIDREARTVSRYNADGTPADFSALGTNVVDGAGGADKTPQGHFVFGGPGEVQIAVDNSGGAADGDIYLTQAGAKVIDIFGAEGSYLGQLTGSSEGSFTEPCGVAVDPAGNVYVGDFGGSIHKFEPAANPPVNGDNVANFPFAHACAVAAGGGPTDGFIFAAHFGEAAAKLDSTTGEEKYEFGAESTATLAVNRADGHVFTAQNMEVREFDASGASSATELSSTQRFSETTGLAIDETSGNPFVTHVGVSGIEVLGPLAPGFSLTIEKGPGDGEGNVETTTPRGISCGFSCAEASDLFSEDTIVELIAEPAGNSKFVGWTEIAGDPGICVKTISPCQMVLGSARELQANFELRKAPEVTGLSPASGSAAGGNLVEITGTGFAEAFQVQFGESVVTAPFVESTDSMIKLEAPAHEVGAVDVVVTSVDGSSAISPADQYTYTVPVPTRALTVTTKGTGSGTVVSSPVGIECGSECVHSFDKGTVVTLSATASPDSRFAGWSGACEGTRTCKVTMRTARSVTATFVVIPPPKPPKGCHHPGHGGGNEHLPPPPHHHGRR
jgi:hypothetical protein